MTPGWKSTEFWLVVVHTVATLALLSGAVPANVESVVALIASGLASAGYALGRSLVKKERPL